MASKLSELGINKDKTMVVKIGAARDSSTQWEGTFGFKWTSSFHLLGIHYDVINHLGDITENNLLIKIPQIENLNKGMELKIPYPLYTEKLQ